MGLGKTVQALFTAELHDSKCTLIVAKKVIIKLVWIPEIKKWIGADDKDILVIEGSMQARSLLLDQAKNYKYVLINYELLLKHLNKLVRLHPSFIIFDEAHTLRNRKSKTSIAFKSMCNALYCPIAFLSGTIVVNTTGDLWPILNVIDKVAFRSYWNFIYEYFHVVDEYSGNFVKKVIAGLKDREKFQRDMSNYIIRRTKAQVLKDLPEKTIIEYEVELNREQRELYNEVENTMYGYIERSNIELNITIVLTQILRLKQICLGIGIFEDGIATDGSKFEALKEIIEDSGDQKIAIYSQFAKGIELVNMSLIKNGISYTSFQGGMKEEDKFDQINKFKTDDNIKCITATLKSGGEGIELCEASILVLMDTPWTQASIDQVTDRIYRRGQTRNVTVYKLCAENTIEVERIREILARKLEAMNAVPVKDDGVL